MTKLEMLKFEKERPKWELDKTKKESDDFFLKGSGFFDYFNKDHYEGAYYACRLLKNS